jgi:prepilin-type N-terminal cleavage/methylation domain-containing protein
MAGGEAMSQRGFTLLEVMISLGLIAVIVLAVFLAQGGGLAASTRNKNVLIAANLARNLINEQELKWEGTPFDRLPKNENGNFAEPYEAYTWEITYEEVDFGVLSELILRQQQESGDTPQQNSDQVVQLFEDYLKRSVRRMLITIRWPESGGTTTQSYTQLLVNYDQEFGVGL